jgi:hypothetical protein
MFELKEQNMATRHKKVSQGAHANKAYTTLNGQSIAFELLDAGERACLATLTKRFRAKSDWNDFDNEWTSRLAELYDSRGIPRSRSRRSALFRIAQDMSSRLAIEQGYAREPDYRDELELLINTRFKSRRDFCKATGISEDMLSHVLARRKHVSMDALTDALARIGYAIHIVPRHTSESRKRTAV